MIETETNCNYVKLYEQLCEIPQEILISILENVPSLAAVDKSFYRLGWPALVRSIADPNGITKVGQFNPLRYKRRKEQSAYLTKIANDYDKRMHVRSLGISIANDIVTSDLAAAMGRLTNVRHLTVTGFVNAPLSKLLSEVSMSNVTNLTLNLWAFEELNECISSNALELSMPSLQHLQLHSQCGFMATRSDTLIYPPLDTVVSTLRVYFSRRILPCFDFLIVRGLIVSPHLKVRFPQLRGSEFDRARVFRRRKSRLVEVREVNEKSRLLASAYGVAPTKDSVSDMLAVW